MDGEKARSSAQWKKGGMEMRPCTLNDGSQILHSIKIMFTFIWHEAELNEDWRGGGGGVRELGSGGVEFAICVDRYSELVMLRFEKPPCGAEAGLRLMDGLCLCRFPC